MAPSPADAPARASLTRKRRFADQPPPVVTKHGATRGRPPREDRDPAFVWNPIPADKARANFPKRYQRAPAKRNGEEEEVKARCHYRAAKVDGIVYKLGDDVLGKESLISLVESLNFLREKTTSSTSTAVGSSDQRTR